MKTYLFTSESVSEGHPDKVADQISDAILDDFLRQDSEARVACETFCTTGLVVIAGEVASEHAYVDIQKVARDVIRRIGYTKSEYQFDADSCGIISAIHDQSSDISRGVAREDGQQGAGDQGMMFGYACSDTEEYMPLPLALSHKILQILQAIRKDPHSPMPYLRPDAKSQFTIEYDALTGEPLRVHTIVLSTQHDEFASDAEMQERIISDVKKILIPALKASLPQKTAELFKEGTPDQYTLLVNPTGKFVIGGPAGDTGLTGRKIIVDTYGGKGAHGGGAFSGKDPSKVDRSAAYAARYIAKNFVAAGVVREMLVQVSYAIGEPRPVSIYVDTYGTAGKAGDGHLITDDEIVEAINRLVDMRPAAIIGKFQLKNPIFQVTASYGHMGRKPYTAPVKVLRDGVEKTVEVQFFGWEKLDLVDDIKKFFSL